MTDFKQQPLFPDLEVVPTPVEAEELEPDGPAQPGDFLFLEFKAGFRGVFMISPVDINAALRDWNNPEPVLLMVLPTPQHPGISGLPATSEDQMLAMTIIDKRIVHRVELVPGSELQTFMEEYERDHPNQLGNTVQSSEPDA